jgi:hypothetical protein
MGLRPASSTPGVSALGLAGEAGLEPATCGFGDRCSNQLSYSPALSCFALPLVSLFHFFVKGVLPAERTKLLQFHFVSLLLLVAGVGVIPSLAHRAGHQDLFSHGCSSIQ